MTRIIILRAILLPVLAVIMLAAGMPLASGQGKNEEVTMIAPYIPSIGDATKISFKPEIKPEDNDTAKFSFSYTDRPYPVHIDPQPLEAIKYGQGDKPQLYRNFAKIGIGNYYTPYLDFMATSLQSEKLLFGARLKHHSSQGKIKGYPVSAYSHNLIDIFGKTFFKSHTLSLEAGYDRDVVHFYGFQPDSFPAFEFTKENIRQRFQHLDAGIEFSSNYRENDKLNHSIRLGVDHFTDLYGSRETEVGFKTRFDKSFKAGRSDFNHAVALDFGLDFLNFRDSISSSSPFFMQFKPVYRLHFGQYRFMAGIDVSLAATDSPGGSSVGIDVFPLLKAEVIVIPSQLSAYAEISGERTINSYRNLAGINPFIISNPQVSFTDEQFSIGGGITGNAAGINFHVSAAYSYINDMALFVTDTALVPENRFKVIYDDLNRVKIQAGLGYVKTGRFSARMNAAYYYYKPENELKAWHLPDYEVDLDASYTFLGKYTAKLSLLALGSKYAPVYASGETASEKLNGALDLGAGAEYEISHMLTAWLDINNILNQHYQRWQEYPVQGILIMAGVKLSF